MKVFRQVTEWQKYRTEEITLDAAKAKATATGQSSPSLGFIPTMGALHDGHLELVRRARLECQRTLVSIFINPTQFNDPHDLKNYPQDLKGDLEKLEKSGCDFALVPEASEIYPDNFTYQVSETDLSSKLCGVSRPGHFKGMLTVVLKLLMIARAEKAFFGEKDYQQLELIRGMAKSFFLPTEIRGIETVREKDGLAMSSRNLKLSNGERSRAPLFSKALQSQKSIEEIKMTLKNDGFEIDYIEELRGRRFGAVKLGSVRLIDNVKI